MGPKNEYIAKMEDVGDQVFRTIKPALPLISRACLVASFVDDGFRMISQFTEQSTLIGESWGTGQWLGILFVLTNMVVQFCGALLILVQKHVQYGCFALAAIVFLQNLIYLEWFEMVLFLKSLGMLGGVLMLLVESRIRPKTSGTGMLTEEKASADDYLQVAARCLLAVMLFNLLSLRLTVLDMSANIFYVTLLVLTLVGYKARLCALLFVFVSIFRLFVHYDFWNYEGSMNDYMKYKFFQSISCMGGFLLVLRMGAGYVSLDEMKKRE